jgi:hypothetical protein
MWWYFTIFNGNKGTWFNGDSVKKAKLKFKFRKREGGRHIK